MINPLIVILHFKNKINDKNMIIIKYDKNMFNLDLVSGAPGGGQRGGLSWRRGLMEALCGGLPLEPGPEGLASSSSSSFVVVRRRVRRGRCADQAPPLSQGPKVTIILFLKVTIILLLKLTLQRVLSSYSS